MPLSIILGVLDRNTGASSRSQISTMGKSDIKSTSPILIIVRKLGLNNSRKIIHSLKVGLALTLASLLVLVKRPYHWIGQNAVWAVITVVVVFETSAGATLSKGLNRGLGTVVAGLLALGVAHLADLFQATGEPIFIGAMVFISGLVCTFLRAIPTVKKKFDYGVMIFMLTFCMVLVTGYRMGDEVTRATDRLLTILIGGLISLAVSSFLFPHWAGQDLHRLTADNFDNLGDSLEGCVHEYVRGEAQPIVSNMTADDADPIYSTCRAAIKSRNTEEALVVFASWEPPHGRFRLGYPWKQYLTVGAMIRHCAYSVLALHGCLRSEIQAPKGLRIILANDMLVASRDAACLLRELGGCIREMHKPKGSTKDLLKNASRAAEAIKESISKHSYLLATPESWPVLEDCFNQRSDGTSAPSTSAYETIMSKSKLANPNRIEQTEAALCQNRGCEPSVHDHGTEVSLQVETLANVKSDELDKYDRRSVNAPRLHRLLEDDALLSSSANTEPASRSPDRTTHLVIAGDVFTEESSDRSRVDDIAGAASLISFASILVETLARLEHLVEAVQILSELGRFRACTCSSSRVHVGEHCIYVRDDDGKTVYSQLDKDPSRSSQSLPNSRSSSHLPPNAPLVSAE